MIEMYFKELMNWIVIPYLEIARESAQLNSTDCSSKCLIVCPYSHLKFQQRSDDTFLSGCSSDELRYYNTTMKTMTRRSEAITFPRV